MFSLNAEEKFFECQSCHIRNRFILTMLSSGLSLDNINFVAGWDDCLYSIVAMSCWYHIIQITINFVVLFQIQKIINNKKYGFWRKKKRPFVYFYTVKVYSNYLYPMYSKLLSIFNVQNTFILLINPIRYRSNQNEDNIISHKTCLICVNLWKFMFLLRDHFYSSYCYVVVNWLRDNLLVNLLHLLEA